MPHYSFSNGASSTTLEKVSNNASTNYQNARRRRAWKNKLLSPSPATPASGAAPVIPESSCSQILSSTQECSLPTSLNPPDSARMILDSNFATPSLDMGLIPENASESVVQPEADMYVIIPLESSEYLVYLIRELNTAYVSGTPGRAKFIDIGLTRALRDGAKTTILMGSRIFLVQVVEIFPISNKFVAPEIKGLGIISQATQTGEIDLSPQVKNMSEVTFESRGKALSDELHHLTKQDYACNEDKSSCSQLESKAVVSLDEDIEGILHPEYNVKPSIIFRENLDNFKTSQSHDTPGVDLEELKYFKDYCVLPFVKNDGPSPSGMKKPFECLSSPLLTINNNDLNSSEFTFSPFDDEEEIKVYGEPWTPIRPRPKLPAESPAVCTDGAAESPAFLGVAHLLPTNNEIEGGIIPSLKPSVRFLSKRSSSSSLKPPQTPLDFLCVNEPLSPVSRLRAFTKDNHTT